MRTVLEQMGGEGVVSDVVTRFYEKALSEPRLAGYFHGTNIHLLREHQTRLFTAALRGEPAPTGREDSSTDPGIHYDEYGLVIGCLADALRDSAVSEDSLSEILFAVAPLARDVITVPAVTR
ncbi:MULTISPECIES: group 1 truncated hemoglobin [unclassified Actinopolyspora]|uniref:group I truncated hemoglobin n=1 Tax=Actinopolyspora TaxID=1849 RepID=UPI0013F64752|nr:MULTISPECIES: group 1 truncated hemoglobin [unclassified Actinopolyspora]NHD17624.1 group 1 truncated hemoglobin [Actinopolyspora sp. BKK2]NHE76643.1 group 1 truncated hemoglobin [Actinopolyspora sp. BKK1]